MRFLINFLLGISILSSPTLCLSKVEGDLFTENKISIKKPSSWKFNYTCTTAPLELKNGKIESPHAYPCLISFSGIAHFETDNHEKISTNMWGTLVENKTTGNLIEKMKKDYNSNLKMDKDMLSVDSPFMTTVSGVEAARSGYKLLTLKDGKESRVLYEKWVFNFHGKTYELEFGAYTSYQKEIVAKMVAAANWINLENNDSFTPPINQQNDF